MGRERDGDRVLGESSKCPRQHARGRLGGLGVTGWNRVVFALGIPGPGPHPLLFAFACKRLPIGKPTFIPRLVPRASWVPCVQIGKSTEPTREAKLRDRLWVQIPALLFADCVPAGKFLRFRDIIHIRSTP